jgi:hypothetical protein
MTSRFGMSEIGTGTGGRGTVHHKAAERMSVVVVKRFCIRCLKARETEDIPLVKLTPMLVKMGYHDLTNRVSRDEVCASYQKPRGGERRHKTYGKQREHHFGTVGFRTAVAANSFLPLITPFICSKTHSIEIHSIQL